MSLEGVIRYMKPTLLSALCAAFLVSQAHAQGLLQTKRVSADLANQAVAEVVAKCASEGYAVSAVLVDADGVQQAILRGNRAGFSTPRQRLLQGLHGGIVKDRHERGR